MQSIDGSGVHQHGEGGKVYDDADDHVNDFRFITNQVGNGPAPLDIGDKGAGKQDGKRVAVSK